MHLESTIVRKRDTLVVQLISFISTHVAEDNMGHRSSGGLDLIEDPFPLVDVPVSVRSDSMPFSVSLEPPRKALKFTWQDEYVHARASVPTGHAMLVPRFG